MSADIKRDIVYPLGSCATLIVEHCQSQWWPGLPTAVAELLYGAIIIDTDALHNKNKTTERDVAALKWLEENFARKGRWQSRDKVLKDISRAKEDVSGLSALDVLAKDFKKVPGTKIGMSTVPMTVDELGEKMAAEGDSEPFKKFAEENALSAVLVRTMESTLNDTDNSRKLVMYVGEGEDAGLKTEIVEALTEPCKMVECAPDAVKESAPTATVYALHRSNSRKQIMPLIQDHFAAQNAN